MKYLVMIHSNPQPWGHPTSDTLAEHQALPPAERTRLNADFDAVMEELSASGELKGGEALGNPRRSKLYRYGDGAALMSDGPYSETKEHLAGFFLIDVESQQRAEQVAARFVGPGETVELRPTAWADAPA